MFESAALKFHRANHHICDLERQFEAFVAEKPHRVRIENRPETGQLHVRIQFLKPLPSDIALIVGDAVHNLRAALDHVVWRMVGIDHGTQDRYLKFPFGDNRVNFEAMCKGIKTPSQWVKDFLIGLEAFPGGSGERLYKLKLLNDADKHAVIIPVARATTHPTINVLNPDGSVHMQMKGNVFIGGADDIPILLTGAGMSIELEDDTNCAPQIFIDKPSVKVIPALEEWSRDVILVIAKAERAVLANVA